jgi:hypothetical protein
MLQKISTAIMRSRNTSLARAFTILGWAGFWLQVVFGSLPILVMASIPHLACPYPLVTHDP